MTLNSKHHPGHIKTFSNDILADVDVVMWSGQTCQKEFHTFFQSPAPSADRNPDACGGAIGNGPKTIDPKYCDHLYAVALLKEVKG